MFTDQKTQYCQDVSSSQLDLKIQYKNEQNTSKLLYGYQQTNSEVYRERQKAQNSQHNMKEKNKVQRLTLTDFKTDHKAIETNTGWHW